MNKPDDLWERAAIIKDRKLGKRSLKRSEVSDECKHLGWVIHDVVGENRYLCKECDARLRRHPRARKVGYFASLDVIEQFRKGLITLQEASSQACMAFEDLQRASEQLRNVNLPARTTSLVDIEAVFPTPGSTISELFDLWKDPFPDITDVEYYPVEGSIDDCALLIFSFVDNTRQRVKFARVEFDEYRRNYGVEA